MKVARISNHFSLGPKTNTYGIEMVLRSFLHNSTLAKRNWTFINLFKILSEQTWRAHWVAYRATNCLSYQILKLYWKSQLVASSKFNISWKIFCIFSEQTWRALGSPLRQPIFCHIKYSNCLEKVNWLLLQNSTFRENFSVIFSEQTWRAHGVASRATNCLPLFSRGAHGPRVSCNSSQLCLFWECLLDINI